jgi:crossover junction endodeoxyribonuclease RuvC
LQKASKIILGIDPGTVVMGYGLIAINGNSIQLIEMSILKLSAKKDIYERLQLIHAKVVEIIEHHHPDVFAIEAPFFGKNVQSMLKLGRAQGVAIAAAMQAGLSVTEYSPKKVKQSVTGNGNADKVQVWKMLQRIFKLTDRDIKYMDASDALAVALCHHYQTNTIVKTATGKVKGWEEFIAKNPQRVKKAK